MARPLRVEFENAHYHIIARGDELKLLFVDDYDFKRYIRLLHRYRNEFRVEIIAYCLMNTHLHLEVKTPLANVSKFMHALHTAYTSYYNFSHRRRGHLFQGRFKSPLVERDSYLLELSRYIHNQPVRAGICSRPIEYQWSSYRFFVTSQISQIVSPEIVLRLYGDDVNKARVRYRRFVEKELGPDIMEEVTRRVVYGSDIFQAKILALINDKSSRDLPEVRVLRRGIKIDRIQTLVADNYNIKADCLTRKGKRYINREVLEARNLALYLARLFTEKPHIEIGKAFGGLCASRVSRIISRMTEQLKTDTTIQGIAEEVIIKIYETWIETSSVPGSPQ